MAKLKLTTVTLNPALDLNGWLPALQPGELNRIAHSQMVAAGKGVNVAAVASDLGAQVYASGLLGEDNQQAFVQLFQAKGIEDQFIRSAGETRVNIKLGEEHGRTTELNFPGMAVPPQAMQQLIKRLEQLAAECELFVLAGSLPASLAEDSWQPLLAMLVATGKKVLLDSSGAALCSALQNPAAMPYLIKPNAEELAELVGADVKGYAAQKAAADVLLAKGVKEVVISNAEQGVSWYWQTGELHAQAPQQPVVSSVGAGDSLVAGVAVGLAQGKSRRESLQLGVAVSALAVTQSGVGVNDQAALNLLLSQVRLSETAF